MKLLERISRKIGFTQTETNVILFILAAIVVGSAVNLIKNFKNDNAYLEFSYKVQDSLFNAAMGEPDISDTTTTENIEKKKIDSQHELLDFAGEKNAKGKSGKAVAGKIININAASVSELGSIPGIGKTVAERIIEYRDKHKRIKRIDELLNVKGIGKTKLKKIEKLISIE